MSAITIRVLEPSDADCYRALFLGGLQEAPTAFVTSHAEMKDAPLSAFEKLLSIDGTADRCVIGAFSFDGALVGSVVAQRAGQPQIAHKAGLYRLYVVPAWRRQGVGRRLLSVAIDWAKKAEGLRLLDVVVIEASESARSLYRSAGFAPYAWEPEAVHINGTYYALESLRMMLNEA